MSLSWMFWMSYCLSAPTQMRSKERRSPRSFSRYDDYERDGRYRRSRSRSYDRRRSRSPSYERRPRRSDSPREWVLSVLPSRLHNPCCFCTAVGQGCGFVLFLTEAELRSCAIMCVHTRKLNDFVFSWTAPGLTADTDEAEAVTMTGEFYFHLVQVLMFDLSPSEYTV